MLREPRGRYGRKAKTDLMAWLVENRYEIEANNSSWASVRNEYRHLQGTYVAANLFRACLTELGVRLQGRLFSYTPTPRKSSDVETCCYALTTQPRVSQAKAPDVNPWRRKPAARKPRHVAFFPDLIF